MRGYRWLSRFGLALLCGFCTAVPKFASAACGAPANSIEAENCLPGTPSAVWDIPTMDAGDPTLQGFATEMSVNKGDTVHFKINSTSSSYTVDIYRIGYYGGNGARLMVSQVPNAGYPQVQPSCLTESSTQLIDCGNWSESASWAVPANAVSGIYIARLTRADTRGASHITFVVRDDSSHSDVLFQTADTTWEAYNAYGGAGFYDGSGTAGRAFKVSFNRPFITRSTHSSWWQTHEYPLIRWLEANGYDVTYFSGIDSDRHGNQLLNHKAFLSVGHDEYWSLSQRTQLENAQKAGVHMMFLSSNDVYWKTRWETSIDGSNAPYRTLVCYKESYEDNPIDPQDPPTWGGTWRDPRFSPPADGGRPENALKGQLYSVDAYREDALGVSSEDGKLRFWRNSSVAALPSGSTATFPEIVGYEWDEDQDNGFRPAGVIHLSSATYYVQDHLARAAGSTYSPAWVTHNLTLFKHASGAMVFAAGTMQWSWGLDSHHDHGSNFPPVTAMQQATVNLFADMRIQPVSLQPGLIQASASSDTTPPQSKITFPHDGDVILNGSTVTVTGTASDTGGGMVGAVEISLDNGSTWHPTVGRTQWTYTWVAAMNGSTTLKSRAVDDSLNIETPLAGVTVSTSTGVMMNPSPTLTGLSPSVAVVGGSSFTLTASGSNFIASSILRWNGADRITTVVSSSSITAAIPANDLSSTGTATITVFNPGPGGGLSNGQPFTIGGGYAATVWSNSVVPGDASNDSSSLEVGLKFRSDISGLITGVRFYKNTFNTGPHTGHLWTNSGALLASTTFTSETSSGWQQSSFATPVSISSNTTYVVSYFTSTGYAVDQNYFATSGVDNPPLHALKSGIDGPNAVFLYTSTSAFPTDSYLKSNYWVDVVFATSTLNPAPALVSITPSSATAGGARFTLTVMGSQFAATSVVLWNGSSRATTFLSSSTLSASIPASDLAAAGTVAVSVFTPAPGGGTSNPQTFTITAAPSNPLPSLTSISPSSATAGDPGFTLTASGANFLSSSTVQWNGITRPTTFVSSATLTAAIPGTDVANSGTASVSVFTPGPGGGTSGTKTFTITSSSGSGTTGCSSCTIFASTSVPFDNYKDPNSLELGIKFRSDVSGTITGIRFYKNSFNTGPHTGHLWSTTGTLLATVSFDAETASGWQQANFSTPVSISANTTYIASFFTTTGYGVDQNYFATSGVDNGPLHALKNGVDGPNGVFLYSPTSAYPTDSYLASNYWVDVVFSAAGTHSASLSRAALPAPLLRLPPVASALDTFTVEYPSGFGVAAYDWRILSLETNSENNPLSGRGGPSAPERSDHFPLMSLHLTPGRYRVSVRAIDQTGQKSPEAFGDVMYTVSNDAGFRVYPNPWRSDRDGGFQIHFEGLPVNSTLKIFSIDGREVRQIAVLRGSTIWDRTNADGQTVTSGIYLYLITADPGQKIRGKLAILN